MRDLATTVLLGDPEAAEWARARVNFVPDWGPCAVLGIRRGGELIAGIVFNHFNWPSIEASIASSTPAWCSRRNLKTIFSYPFIQLDCRRIGATTEAGNTHARRFLRRLGFVEEGIARQALPRWESNPTGDAVIHGMLRTECLWLGV